jgi:exosome complex component RRP46
MLEVEQFDDAPKDPKPQYACSTFTMVVPQVTLTHLNRADGSATYTYNGFSIIGAVNGPIEVLRRDEMPEEATIEVNVRPAVGVGSMQPISCLAIHIVTAAKGPKERHLEALLHSTLRSIILTRLIPRTLVQLTLQVRSLPEEEATTGVNSVRHIPSRANRSS